MSVSPKSAGKSKQASNEREIPSSPEIWNSNSDTSGVQKPQNRAACGLRLPTSNEQRVPANDDDDSFRPTASELDPFEFVRGDTELDADTLNGLHQDLGSTVRDLAPSYSSPCGDGERFEPGQGQERRARNERAALDDDSSVAELGTLHSVITSDEGPMSRGPRHHLTDFTSQTSTARNANYLLEATGQLEGGGRTVKRRKIAGVSDRNTSDIAKYGRTARGHSSFETAQAEEPPTPPTSSCDLQRPHPNHSPRDDRSQTLMFAPMDGSTDVRSYRDNSQSCEPDDARSVNRLLFRPFDQRRETSMDQLPSRSGLPDRPRDTGPSTQLPEMRFWVLASKHPRKLWKLHQGLTFGDQTLDSFYGHINSQVDFIEFSSIEVTLSAPNEDWTFCLPRYDEVHFENMKQFVQHKARAGQSEQRNEHKILDVYLVPGP